MQSLKPCTYSRNLYNTKDIYPLEQFNRQETGYRLSWLNDKVNKKSKLYTMCRDLKWNFYTFITSLYQSYILNACFQLFFDISCLYEKASINSSQKEMIYCPFLFDNRLCTSQKNSWMGQDRTYGVQVWATVFCLKIVYTVYKVF